MTLRAGGSPVGGERGSPRRMLCPMVPGGRLGPYELVSCIGAGGSGEVWEAVLHGPGGFRKPVALKVLREDRTEQSERREAMVREARLGASLSHPHIVATWGVSEHEGRWVLAMELVRGASLAAVLRAVGPLPGRALVDLGVPLAAALAHVHHHPEGSLVHRDVKPGNVLIDRTGFPRLADLGISVSVGEDGAAAGTRGYLAPEQAAGRAEPRSDVFGLGALLHVAATLRTPYPRDAVALSALDAARAAPGFLAEANAALPGLGPLLSACLAPDPGDRPTAEALREALAALGAEAPGETLAAVMARAAPAAGVPGTPTGEVPTRVVPNGNLRPIRDRFVGRTDLLRELRSLVLEGRQRLLILHGQGGMGKTRLSLELARAVQAKLPGGAWAFDLSAARTEEEICVVVATALAVRLERRDPVLQLGRVLAARGRALVVLDNLEQCVEHLPATLGEWVRLAPEATFVGTTRVASDLAGEHRIPVAGLVEAEALALVRARLGRPLDPDEEGDARALCAALAGWPLALELAAARAARSGLAAARAALASGDLGADPARVERHQSLGSCLRWSVDLLSPDPRAALGALPVFAGRVAPEAAAAVWGTDPAGALALLEELVDASLVSADGDGFQLHPAVRAFAATLPAPEARARAERLHGRYFAQLAAGLGALHGPHGPARLRALTDATEDLIVACRRAVARGDAPVAIDCLRAAWAGADLTGDAAAVAALAPAVAALPGASPEQRARACWVEGWAVSRLGRLTDARARMEEVSAWAEAAGVPALATLADEALAYFDLLGGRLEASEARARRSLGRWRAAGDPAREARAALALGRVCHDRARLAEAETWCRAALDGMRAVGDQRGEALALDALGRTLVASARWAPARSALEGALALHRFLGSLGGEARTLANLAYLHQEQEEPGAARDLLVAALALNRQLGDRSAEAGTQLALGSLCVTLGDAHAARGWLLAGLEASREVGLPLSEAHAAGRMAGLEIEAGRWSEAERWSALERELGERTGTERVRWSARLHRALLDFALGREDAAERGFREVMDGAPTAVPRLVALARLVQLLATDDRDAEAAPLAEIGLTRARELALAPAEAELHGRLAVLAAREGRRADAADHLAAAQRAAGRVEEPGEAVRALAMQAEVAALAGDRARAEALLHEAERRRGERADLAREIAAVRGRWLFPTPG